MPNSFAKAVLTWFDQHGRKDLPWQHQVTAYHVWVSEIMLQQTQVATVIPYYQRFIQAFPDISTLATAEQDSVLQHWAGLGYYSRARNLHMAAQRVQQEFAGVIPNTLEGLIQLPGIGRSTAGAILSLAYQQPHAILDGNVKRVLARYHAVSGWTGKSTIQKELWRLAEKHLPAEPEPSVNNTNYTQAMMDLGATICTRNKPDCLLCPLNESCKSLQHGNPTDYPSPKPKRVIPDKEAIMLLVMNNEQVLLMKRPTLGIWGGLWSLPQFENIQEANGWFEKQYGEHLPKPIKIPPFSHTFSHFRLHVQPIQVDRPSNAKGIMEDQHILWYNSATNFTGGLPAPIQKLFKRIHL